MSLLVLSLYIIRPSLMHTYDEFNECIIHLVPYMQNNINTYKLVIFKLICIACPLSLTFSVLLLCVQ